MWILYLIISAFLILVLYFAFSKKTENYETTHGYVTHPFPKFPKEINHKNHSEIVQMKIDKSSKCGNCTETEKKLVQHGINSIKQIKKGKYTKVSVPLTGCELCDLFIEGWNRYFQLLEDMSGYIHDNKKLPPKPELIKTNCPICNQIQKDEKDYADKLEIELKCFETGKKNCKHNQVKPISYDKSKSCPKCEETFIKWQKYIFPLIELINYYRFDKPNLKPIS